MSDLDNEEIEATKKLQEKIKNTPDEVIEKAIDNLAKKENEKTADELFDDLDCEKIIEVNNETEEIVCIGYKYKNEDRNTIEDCWVIFLVKAHHISIQNLVSMQELQAINKKCKELGWL